MRSGNRLFLFIALLFLAFSLYGQNLKPNIELYKSATIPPSLRTGADAVVRLFTKELTISAPGKAHSKTHCIVTILNDHADEAAQLLLFYDRKYNSIESAEMAVYDSTGAPIKKYHKNDFYDRSAGDGTSILTDDRLMLISHSIVSYPVTVEMTWENTMNSFAGLPDWIVQEPHYTVENEWLKVSVLPGIGFRHKAKNTTLAPVIGHEGIFDTYSWEAHNLSALNEEEGVPKWVITPSVSLAVNKFAFGGLPGDLSSWKTFGEWIYALNSEGSSLSPQREAEIRTMTASLPSDKEKAKFLYNYLQQNVRYVSIQLGIGGLKPFPASFVDQKKYGDCKALSNYMHALLKAVNIPSYYTLINAGKNEEPADPEFSNNPFNHVILCIPFKNDTTWLECTSSSQPFGKLGTFTENRKGLWITENGGILVNTPPSTKADNRFDAQVAIKLDASGAATAKVIIDATGEYRAMYSSLASQKTVDQKEFIIRSLNLKQPEAFELKHSSDEGGIKQIEIGLEYDKFSDLIAGNKQFYKLFVFDLWRLTVPVTEKRVADFYLDHPLQKTCVTTIELPPGFDIETLPSATALTFSAGSFQLACNFDQQKKQVTITSQISFDQRIIPAGNYSEMQKYLDDVSRAENKKLVIVKKE